MLITPSLVNPCCFSCCFSYISRFFISWARERYVIETKLNHGMHSFGSTRGLSGHQHNPFAAITLGPPSEDYGEVKGFSLIYSGNFLIESEINELGRLRFNMGIHPMALQWHLKPGHQFHTPEAVLVRSSEGLGGMSRSIHRLFLDRLLPRNWSDNEPPVLLNSWEAKYFHVNHNNIVEMARQVNHYYRWSFSSSICAVLLVFLPVFLVLLLFFRCASVSSFDVSCLLCCSFCRPLKLV
jgi:alpha-galactosidase